MPRATPARGGSRGDRAAEGPRPFSREWLQLSPEQQQPPMRRAPNLPAWFPSDRVLSGILVLLLVLFTVAFNGGPTLRTNALIAAPTKASDELAAVTGTQEVIVAPPSATAEQVPTTTSDAAPTQTAAVPAITVSPPTVATDSRALLPKYRIVSYYGHPADVNMGILGQLEMVDLLAQLRDEAQAYELADPDRPVMPAFEVIASVAQNWPADDDTYLLHTDEATIQKYVDFARENGIILILDLQIGHSTIPEEIERVSKWLVEPFVHIALDSEFAMQEGGLPGTDYGSLDASDIAVAQQLLAEIVVANNLPPKLLIVHRFTEGMVTNADQVEQVTGVQTVIDFDGFGDPASKIEGYDLFLEPGLAEFAGIKLFYEKDAPLMQPYDVVELDRPPDVVIYQ